MTDTLLLPAGMTAPAYATPRNPANRSDGPRIGRLSRTLGKPFMPWQQHVVDVATERDAVGNFVYDIVFVTVPRQSGKTTLLDVVMTDRAMMTPAAKLFYTAQTQKDAVSRFRDLADIVQHSPFAAIAEFRWSAGSTSMRFPNNSSVRVFAPTDDALHGETPLFVGLDEIFAHSEALGDAMLEGAILPAMITLAGKTQVWMISTAGTAESTFMRKWVERGRAGGRAGMAYFEWSLPDGADPYDPDAIASFHPGVGHTIELDALMRLATGSDMSRAKWLRGFCNRWTEASEPIFDLDEWAALAGDQLKPARSDLVISYDVHDDTGAIVAAWRDARTGRAAIRTVHRAPGTIWMTPLLRQIAAWKPRAIVADDGGQTRRVTAQARKAGLTIETLGARDAATAADLLLTLARERMLLTDGSKTLQQGIAHAAMQRNGDAVRFSRSASTGFIGGIIAAAGALHRLDLGAAPLPKPLTKF